tara:strand:- start:34 stop:267 length:234 start_codon:yes stop_codon:yes gene_type:complete
MKAKEIMIKCIALCNLRIDYCSNSNDFKNEFSTDQAIQDEYDYWNQEEQYKSPQEFFNNNFLSLNYFEQKFLDEILN